MLFDKASEKAEDEATRVLILGCIKNICRAGSIFGGEDWFKWGVLGSATHTLPSCVFANIIRRPILCSQELQELDWLVKTDEQDNYHKAATAFLQWVAKTFGRPRFNYGIDLEAAGRVFRRWFPDKEILVSISHDDIKGAGKPDLYGHPMPDPRDTEKRISSLGPPWRFEWKQSPVATVPQSDGCFIATHVFESPFAPEVVALRAFRDQTLIQTNIGKWLSGFYSTFLGPQGVVFMERFPNFRSPVRACLRQIVRLIRIEDQS
jgi:hypothetical protein